MSSKPLLDYLSLRIQEMKDINLDSHYLLEYEKCDLGYEPRDLKGQSFLKSSLNHLLVFLETKEGGAQDGRQIISLSLSDWTIYPKFLIDRFALEKSELNNCLQITVQFLEWLKSNHLPDLVLNDIQNSLRFGQKEVERALFIRRKIQDYNQNQSFPQFQSFDLTSVEMELEWLQFQDNLEDSESHQGEYEITSKMSQGFKVLLNDPKRNKQVILSFPKDLFDLLHKGDHFYLRFDENSEGHQRFNHINFITPTPVIES